MAKRGTPDYRGRPLPRPHDDLADQGLAFDLETLDRAVDRRVVLQALGLSAAAAGLAACGGSTTTKSTTTAGTTAASSGGSTALSASASASPTTQTTSTTPARTAVTLATKEIPEETAGPFPGDGSNGPDVLEASGIVRPDIRSSFGTGSATADGVPMTLQLTITDLVRTKPFRGVAVYVWHCDRDGNYSMYADSIADENYLRGVQIANRAGVVTFTSIVPACYSGRWPHIHFEVYPDRSAITDASNAIATSQVALPKKMCDAVYATDGYHQSVGNFAQVTLSSDNVFGNDSAADQVATVTGNVRSGYRVRLDVGVDTTTEAGGAGGAPPAPGGNSRP